MGKKEEPFARRTAVIQAFFPAKNDVEATTQVVCIDFHYLICKNYFIYLFIYFIRYLSEGIFEYRISCDVNLHVTGKLVCLRKESHVVAVMALFLWQHSQNKVVEIEQFSNENFSRRQWGSLKGLGSRILLDLQFELATIGERGDIFVVAPSNVVFLVL